MGRLIYWTCIAIAFLSLFRFYTRYKEIAAPIPPGVHLAGMDLSGLKEPAEIRAHLEQIYNQPIAVMYADERLWLDPSEVNFQLEVEQMVWEASQYLEGIDFIDISLREALGLPQRVRNVEARFLLDQNKLYTWLQTVAQEQDRPPQQSRVTPRIDRWSHNGTEYPNLPQGYVGTYTRDWRWSPGSPGYELDIEASMPGIVNALTQEEERMAQLVLDETSSPPPQMVDLASALDNYLSNFPGFAAVYVHDILQEKTAEVDVDVSFSGMSTLKIAVVAAVMEQIEGLPAGDNQAFEIGRNIDYALGESNNFAANQLLRYLGNGDIPSGARNFTSFMRTLGFANTYMQSGYDANAQFAQISTPGNTRDDWQTNPDSNLQTTTREMGEILTDIYHCTEGKGRLLEVFPDTLNPEECRYILFYLGRDEFEELLWSGLPRPGEAWILHKHGFAFETHSDVALVWGPTGPYVISIFLYRPGWMDWPTSNTAMKDVSRITWNFFEFRAQLLDEEPPPPMELTPPPAYVPVPTSS
ncbi:MAG: serine hydrolase [Chloroflexota bacterium]